MVWRTDSQSRDAGGKWTAAFLPFRRVGAGPAWLGHQNLTPLEPCVLGQAEP